MKDTDATLDGLLTKTSRTFALSIPLLPEPTRREVTLAYLLFRIADTFEDATEWASPRKVQALQDFSNLLQGDADPSALPRHTAGWVDPPPILHEGYQQLMSAVPFVMEQFWSMQPAAQDIVRRHLSRTVAGMAGFVAKGRERGRLQLSTLQDLRDYCYVVAGIVGEMLTDLYLLDRASLTGIQGFLRARARLFGEGLQLVNILKDSRTDFEEGRIYLPPGVDRGQVFALARRDLEAARDYTLALQQAAAPRGLVAFNALPVLLARASLDRVEEAGPGVKLGRPEVLAIFAGLHRDLDAGAPAV